jgi:hypothetical protein
MIGLPRKSRHSGSGSPEAWVADVVCGRWAVAVPPSILGNPPGVLVAGNSEISLTECFVWNAVGTTRFDETLQQVSILHPVVDAQVRVLGCGCGRKLQFGPEFDVNQLGRRVRAHEAVPAFGSTGCYFDCKGVFRVVTQESGLQHIFEILDIIAHPDTKGR